ncbi:ribosome maturation protein SBDS-like, partial [Papaver somniferum]|uniref:ribosome maturation protein SBDS-like n=1 Tax=Papaver somniferum TaxID=3469 RepID=UPI000E70609A
LPSDIVYSNASKRTPAKSKDLIAAFQTDDLSEICIEILQNGEIQSESQLSRKFREIAAIIMQETFNPETKRPYTLSMIEKLMHGIHFAVAPHNNSKNQALGVICELQKHYPIKRTRSPMRLRLIIPEKYSCSLMEKLDAWNAEIVSKVEYGNQQSLVCEVEPIFSQDCDALVRSLYGRLEILAVSVHFEKDADVVDDCEDWDDIEPVSIAELDDDDQWDVIEPGHHSPVPLNTAELDDHWDVIEPSHHPPVQPSTAELDEIKLSEVLQKQSISTGNGADKKQLISTRNDGADKRSAEVEVVEVKQRKCSICNALVGDAKQFR